MRHIETIKVVDKTYPSNVLDIGFEIECESINLLVGNQGCGKSTLLTLLQQNHKDIELKLAENTIKNGVSSFYFDSERDNPRIKDPQMFTKPSGEDVGIGYGGALASRFRSHGEVLEEFIIGPTLKAKDCVILLDEPESGLSITNQFRMIAAIKKAVENNCQFFIATHCYPLIKEFNVISLEHKEKMRGDEFISKVSLLTE
jgi:predicted ATPase